jgi:hypothetical protein
MEGSTTETPLKINPEFVAGRVPDGLDEIEVLIVRVQQEAPGWRRFAGSIFENTVANIIAAVILSAFTAYIVGFQAGATEKVGPAAQPTQMKSCEPTRFARSD